MLKYRETNWRSERGFGIHDYKLAIDTISPSKVSKEQHKKIEKISLVAFLNKDQKKIFAKLCRRLKKNNKYFYQNSNLHATLFGFGPMDKKDIQTIRKEIQLFTKSKSHKLTLNIRFNSIRPGSMYYGNKTLKPIKGLGNGTVVAIGDVSYNLEFHRYTISFTKYLLNQKKIQHILSKNFRRKFPTAWVTLGYYDKQENFKIDTNLEVIFRQHKKLNDEFCFPVSEISLVKSKYKNLRYPKLIQKYRL